MLRDRLPEIADMLEAGESRRRIAEAMGVSAPAITQFVAREPSLRRFRARATLLSQREQLVIIRRDALDLLADIRRALRELNEELEADRIDRLLGLR